MNTSKIVNEKDPVLREIWANGYTHIYKDIVSHSVKLINKAEKIEKSIPLNDYNNCIMTLRFCVGSNLAGGIHKWIKEADGSADRFRKLIK